MNHYERVCASVNLDAIINNIKAIHEKQGEGLKIMAVVKSDGYGHGALPIAKCLEEKDFIFGFATANGTNCHTNTSQKTTLKFLNNDFFTYKQGIALITAKSFLRCDNSIFIHNYAVKLCVLTNECILHKN